MELGEGPSSATQGGSKTRAGPWTVFFTSLPHDELETESV